MSFITSTETVQSPKVVDLKTGEETNIKVAFKKFVLSDNSDIDAAYSEAVALVGDKQNVITALLSFATSAAYQAAKDAAFAGGNYLNQDLKSKIVQVMRGNAAYVDMSAGDCYKKWLAGYTAAPQKPGAIKVLDLAKQLGGDDLGL